MGLMLRTLFLLVALLSCGVLAQEPKQEPSLVELARQARQKQAKLEKQPPVLTNADLRRLQGAKVTTGTAPPPPTPAMAEAARAGAPASGDLSGQDLEQFRAGLAEAGLNLKNTLNQGLVLQLRMNNLQNAYLSESDGSTRQHFQAQLQQTLQQISQNKRSQTQARKVLEAMQKNARASGLPLRMIKKLTGKIPKMEDILSPSKGPDEPDSH
ncbi:MAG: hypothetical protein ACE5JX_21860 [Acidobacteriota bacterium]